MRQTDYTLGACRRRYQRLRKRLHRLLFLKGDVLAVFVAYRLDGVRRDLRRMTSRKKIARGIYFNLSIFSIEECLKLFRSRQKELCTMGKVLSWRSRTERLRYCCSSLVATCIVTRRLSTPIRCFELDILSCMSSQALSEIFGSFYMTVSPCTRLCSDCCEYTYYKIGRACMVTVFLRVLLHCQTLWGSWIE